MRLAGLVGKLLAAWGLLEFVLATVTHDRDYPGATWVLTYLGLGLVTVGGVMWWHADAVEDPLPSDSQEP